MRGEVAGKPNKSAVESLNGFQGEVMVADGEGAHSFFEFLYGLVANRDTAAREMEPQEFEAFDKVGNLCFGGRQAEAQILPDEVVHESQSLFGLGVATVQDHEAVTGLCQSLVEDIQDDVRQQGRNHTALGRAGEK